MSMYEFTHQLDRLNNSVEIYTSSGRQNSPLMRQILPEIYRQPHSRKTRKHLVFVPNQVERFPGGALDSLGMAEQRGIASRMFRAYPKLFIDNVF